MRITILVYFFSHSYSLYPFIYVKFGEAKGMAEILPQEFILTEFMNKTLSGIIFPG